MSGQTSVVRLPEETPEAVAGFLTLVYTGHISSTAYVEELWAQGDRFSSPVFMNEVMHPIFAIYGQHDRWLSARGTDIAYSQTAPGSKLRNFIREYVDCHGPLCPRAITDEEILNEDGAYGRDWRTFIEGGGELVSYMALAHGARYKKATGDYTPSLVHLDQGEDMVDETSRGINDFIQGKMRAR